MKKIALLIVSSLSLAACGGGGSSSSDPVLDASVNGFWSGSFVEDGTTLESEAIIYNGTVMAVTGPSKQGGSYSVSGSGLSATLTSNLSTTTTASASIVEGSTVSGTFSTSYGSSGTLSLSYSNKYDEPSSQDMISGSWESYYNSAYTTMTVSSDGTVTGSNDSGCIFNGTITTPDTNHALFIVDIDISNCGSDSGNLSGFATKPNDTNLNVIGMLNGIPYLWVFA